MLDGVPDYSRHVRDREVAFEMIDAVTSHRDVWASDIIGPCRGADIVPARHEAIWLVRDLNRYSLPEIGLIFGGRHHTTIMYGIRAHERRMRKTWAALGRATDAIGRERMIGWVDMGRAIDGAA